MLVAAGFRVWAAGWTRMGEVRRWEMPAGCDRTRGPGSRTRSTFSRARRRRSTAGVRRAPALEPARRGRDLERLDIVGHSFMASSRLAAAREDHPEHGDARPLEPFARRAGRRLAGRTMERLDESPACAAGTSRTGSAEPRRRPGPPAAIRIWSVTRGQLRRRGRARPRPPDAARADARTAGPDEVGPWRAYLGSLAVPRVNASASAALRRT